MTTQLRWIIVCVITVTAALLAALGFSRTVTVLSEQEPLSRKHRIVIDAGHGLPDGGAISCTGRPESEYNLEIAKRLRDLMHLLGHETVMIRDSEDSVYTSGTTIAQKKVSDLTERVRVIRETRDPVLISIHQNSFPDGQYSGTVVLYADTPDSKRLAESLRTAVKIHMDPDNSRSIKQASGIYLMEHIRCTGILIECGFLSNAAEEARLRDPEHQKKLCCVIGTTVSAFLSDVQKSPCHA